VSSYYIYDGEKSILEYNSSGVITSRNVYGKGIDEILMRTDTTANSGQPFYYQQNHEGSVTHLTDASGTVIEKYRYDVFGAPTAYDGNGNVLTGTAYNNRFLFTGREYRWAYGFYEYRARAYHPTVGRFMSEDPKLFVRSAGATKSSDDWSLSGHPDEAEWNLFRYCGNDPLDFTDPLGLEFNGDLDAKEVEIIPGRFGQTGVTVKVVPEVQKDGDYKLRLDVKVTMREVARTAKWHGRIVTRKEQEKRVTREVHEKREHNKDWRAFHDEHQKDVSSARFHSRDAAEAAAKAQQSRLTNEAMKAASKINQHEDRQRWEPIEEAERPH
jgi:RHS repeat-associated protein